MISIAFLDGDRQGPFFPNSTATAFETTFEFGCKEGCLFRLDIDPTEHHDLAKAQPYAIFEHCIASCSTGFDIFRSLSRNVIAERLDSTTYR
jgi:hypothetical protein